MRGLRGLAFTWLLVLALAACESDGDGSATAPAGNGSGGASAASSSTGGDPDGAAGGGTSTGSTAGAGGAAGAAGGDTGSGTGGAGGSGGSPSTSTATVPSFESAFEPDVVVNELDEADVVALCAELEAWSDEFYAAIEQDLCEFSGIFLAAFLPGDPVANCEDQTAMCLAAPTEAMTTCDVAQAAMCDATIAEIDACLEATSAVFVEAFANLSCELALDPNALPAGGPTAPVTPEACTALDQKCPGTVSVMPPMPAM